MTSYLIDINVWLAMTWNLHPQHASASGWYVSLNQSTIRRFYFAA
jgi:predicted nucleic acid-binding protein